MEFEEKFSDEFIAEVIESEEAYARGEYIEVKIIPFCNAFKTF
jgi:hypothetical protein